MGCMLSQLPGIVVIIWHWRLATSFLRRKSRSSCILIAGGAPAFLPHQPIVIILHDVYGPIIRIVGISPDVAITLYSTLYTLKIMSSMAGI